MRVSFVPGPGHPVRDLHLTAGVTVDALRPHLARLTGSAAALHAPLAVGTLLLDESHLTGTFPLVAGAEITLRQNTSADDVRATARSARSPADDDVFAAARAPFHVAALTGPDAGTVHSLGTRLLVGRSPAEGGDTGAAVGDAGLTHGSRTALGTTAPVDGTAAGEWASSSHLMVRDPLVSRRHLAVVTRRGRTWLRDLGSANGSRRTRRWARHRLGGPVPRWWSRWREGDRVTAGATVLELRRPAPPEPTPDADAEPRPAARRTAPSGTAKALLVVTAVAPALGAIALATGTRNPALLAVGLAGPALAPLLLRHRSDPAPAPSRHPATVSASELTISLARAVLTGTGGAPDDALQRLAPAGTLAVRGPDARRVAATLVLAAQPRHLEAHVEATAEHWAWARWLTSPSPDTTDTLVGPDVVVVDGGSAHPGLGGPGRIVVLVDPAPVPSWCTARLDAATGQWLGPDGEQSWALLPGGQRWAEQQARLVAGARCVRAVGAAGLPGAVTLGELGQAGTVEQVEAAWRQADDRLLAVLGAGPGGREATVDLVGEGPHALVAGTTGSGKSEALRALVASLALRYPPTALAFALVDFKGGAGFGALSGLPHVVGTVTDLDAHEAARAISGLAAELRARKELLARVDVTDLRDWPAGAEEPHPGRLVVVVDEFRALAEELPDLMGALVRVATQGRSLGVHLVLATQRPSGVVSAELRANVALRLALRVTDAGDSSDVLDVPDAATISPTLPGRALLRRGPGPVEELQVALVGAAQPPVRPVDEAAPDRPRAVADAAAPDEELVAAVTEAAARWRPGAPRPAAPWLPALPDDVTLAELTLVGSASEQPLRGIETGAGTGRGTGPGTGTETGTAPGTALGTADSFPLPFALADLPDTQSRSVAAWDPRAGHLLAIGGPGSGRSTLLATIGTAALGRGWAVHAVGLPPGTFGPGAPRSLGTVCGPDDPRRLARLVMLLLEAPPRTILLVDEIDTVWRSLEQVGRGAGADRLIELLRDRAVGVAATASGATGPWLSHASYRLVLPVGDDTAESLAGVPRELSGARRGPGRAVWLPAREDPLVCQVARAAADGESSQVTRGSGDDGDLQRDRAPDVTGAGPDGPTPVRLAPVPLTPPRPTLARSRRTRLAVGIGGDAARTVGLDPRAGALVVGPPGSGRSTALAHLVLSAHELGPELLVVARDGPVRAAAGPGSLGFDREPLLAALSAGDRPDAVVVDDLDALARLAPEVTDLLDEAVEDGTALFTSLTTTAALSAFRGAVTALRAHRRGLVLGAHTPGSDEVFGSPLGWHLDPARPAHPGRGVLQAGGRLEPVQVFAPPN